MNTIHRYTVPSKHVKWGINEWNIELGPYRGPTQAKPGPFRTKSGTAPI